MLITQNIVSQYVHKEDTDIQDNLYNFSLNIREHSYKMDKNLFP